MNKNGKRLLILAALIGGAAAVVNKRYTKKPAADGFFVIESPGNRTSELMIGFDDDATDAQIQTVLSNLGGKVVELLPSVYRIKLPIKHSQSELETMTNDLKEKYRYIRFVMTDFAEKHSDIEEETNVDYSFGY